MALATRKQPTLRIKKGLKRETRSQFAALCYRIKGNKVQILLVTTRRTGRWIVPKGWPMDGKTPAECAAQEAWEEAGVEGRAQDRCLGLYSYTKNVDQETGLPCVAMVYPVRVKSLSAKYPEAKERKRKWFSLRKATQVVGEPERVSSNFVMGFSKMMVRIPA